jgi:NTP pyrophosphatase (non-canonical NTP hydrolase)
MDRTEFLERMERADSTVDRKRWDELNKRSIDCFLGDGNPRGHMNLIIAMEELAELQQRISKELRGKGDRTALIEEMADVRLVFGYLRDIFNISDEELDRALNAKLERLEERLDGGTNL